MGPQDIVIHRNDIVCRYSSPSSTLSMVKRVVTFLESLPEAWSNHSDWAKKFAS